MASGEDRGMTTTEDLVMTKASTCSAAMKNAASANGWNFIVDQSLVLPQTNWPESTFHPSVPLGVAFQSIYLAELDTFKTGFPPKTQHQGTLLLNRKIFWKDPTFSKKRISWTGTGFCRLDIDWCCWVVCATFWIRSGWWLACSRFQRHLLMAAEDTIGCRNDVVRPIIRKNYSLTGNHDALWHQSLAIKIWILRSEVLFDDVISMQQAHLLQFGIRP